VQLRPSRAPLFGAYGITGSQSPKTFSVWRKRWTADHVTAVLAELDDLGGGEMQRHATIEVVANAVMVGSEKLQKFERQPFRSLRSCRRDGEVRQATTSSVAPATLRDAMQGSHPPS